MYYLLINASLDRRKEMEYAFALEADVCRELMMSQEPSKKTLYVKSQNRRKKEER
jgi:ribosomal protein S6